MLAGVVEIGGLLIGARQSKLRGGMPRIESQRVLKGLDSRRKLFGLHIGGTQEIPCVGVVRIKLDHVVKGINRGLSVSGVLREQTEVVPRVWIFGVLLDFVFERGPGFVDLLQVQECDAFIQACNRELRIELGRLLEGLESFFEKLLVHVGGAEIVQARGLRWIRFRLGLRWGSKQAKCGQDYASESN